MKVDTMSDESIRPGYKRTEVGVLPEDWTVSPLSSIAFVTSGKRLPKGHSLTDQETPHPYIRVSDMRPGTVSLANIRYVPENVFPLIQNYRIFKEDIFISVAGTLGIIGEVPPELNGANLTENADRITNISCSKRYLLHVLTSPLIQNVIDSVQTVGAQPKLALTRIRNFAIPLPPTQEEQHTIAEALSDVDALLDALDRLIAKKRAIKQGTMQALLTGRVRLPGFTSNPSYKHTDVGEIPEDWEVCPFGQLVNIRNDKVNPALVDPSTPCVELENIGQGTGQLTGYSLAEQSTSIKYRFLESDVLYGRLRAYLRKFWFAEFNGICTTEIWPLKPVGEQMRSEYLFQVVQTDRFNEAASMTYGTHMPRTDWSVISNLLIPVPDPSEQFAYLPFSAMNSRPHLRLNNALSPKSSSTWTPKSTPSKNAAPSCAISSKA